MAVLNELSVTEAFRDLLVGRQAMTDATRKDAVRQVRHYTNDAIYAARAPQGSPKNGYVLLSRPNVGRFYSLTGESGECDSAVLVACFASGERLVSLIAGGVRNALTGFVGPVTMQTGTLNTYGCFVEAEGEQEPEDLFDASEDFSHQYFLTFRVRHAQLTPAGQK